MIASHEPPGPNPPGAEADMLKEVTCECGWQARGTEEEVIAQVIEHGRAVHRRELTAAEVRAIWYDVSVGSA